MERRRILENLIWEKNINNYRKINKFSDLSSESKEALNVLKSGTYFSVYTISSIDQKNI